MICITADKAYLFGGTLHRILHLYERRKVMSSIWEVIWPFFRKVPLCICIHWSVYFLLLDLKPFQDMELIKIHRIKSIVLLFASVVVGIIAKLCELSMLFEIAVMNSILAIIQYVYVLYMSFPKDRK